MGRLVLSSTKIRQLAAGIRSIAGQPECLGRVLKRTEIAAGLIVEQKSCPIGVCLIIFESRPDALPQLAALALKSGNGLLLKGGKEAAHSNAVLHRVICDAIAPAIDPAVLQLVVSREDISELLKLDDCIDLVIPRGSNALVSHIKDNTKIPVLGHADGVCHMFVDATVDLAQAAALLVDAKTDYPAACNAIETVLLHADLVPDGRAQTLLDALSAAGVALHAGPRAAPAFPALPPAPALHHEYSSLDVTIEIVDGLDAAIDHIHAHGSSHTDCVLSSDPETVAAFLNRVDSACVFANASTRFADGFRLGLGAEVGISTSRIHARGPVGVEGLLTTRWVINGTGQLVKKDTGVTYTHKQLAI